MDVYVWIGEDEFGLVAVREYFADCPTVLDVVRRGDDPREDFWALSQFDFERCRRDRL